MSKLPQFCTTSLTRHALRSRCGYPPLYFREVESSKNVGFSMVDGS